MDHKYAIVLAMKWKENNKLITYLNEHGYSFTIDNSKKIPSIWCDYPTSEIITDFLVNGPKPLPPKQSKLDVAYRKPESKGPEQHGKFPI